MYLQNREPKRQTEKGKYVKNPGPMKEGATNN